MSHFSKEGDRMLRSIVIATATMIVAAQVPIAKRSITSTRGKSSNAKRGNNANLPSKASSDTVLVKIGNEVVCQSELELFMKNFLNDQQRLQVQHNDEAKEQVLDYFLRLKIMAAKAQKDGLHNRLEYTNKISIARMQILAQTLVERDFPAIEAKIAVNNEEIKRYFDANQDKFKTPEMFSARHILVSNKAMNNESKALTDEEAQTKIAKIQDDLKHGKSFADAAKEYSDDPGSKDKGGLYEDVVFGRFATEFEQAVRSQEVDKVGKPIKTQYGYHLIEVKKITPAIVKSFEELKESVKEIVIAERKNLAMEKYFDALRREVGYIKFDKTVKN
jgi:peptidyl-prolyl cis-trans isomerase C